MGVDAQSLAKQEAEALVPRFKFERLLNQGMNNMSFHPLRFLTNNTIIQTKQDDAFQSWETLMKNKQF